MLPRLCSTAVRLAAILSFQASCSPDPHTIWAGRGGRRSSLLPLAQSMEHQAILKAQPPLPDGPCPHARQPIASGCHVVSHRPLIRCAQHRYSSYRIEFLIASKLCRYLSTSTILTFQLQRIRRNDPGFLPSCVSDKKASMPGMQTHTRGPRNVPVGLQGLYQRLPFCGRCFEGQSP